MKTEPSTSSTTPPVLPKRGEPEINPPPFVRGNLAWGVHGKRHTQIRRSLYWDGAQMTSCYVCAVCVFFFLKYIVANYLILGCVEGCSVYEQWRSLPRWFISIESYHKDLAKFHRHDQDVFMQWRDADLDIFSDIICIFQGSWDEDTHGCAFVFPGCITSRRYRKRRFGCAFTR